MKNQKGQVILILILVMTVGLGIGLSVVQKSLVDVSTASKVEQSSRAFSAAEAGVEKALRTTSSSNCTSATDPLTCQNFTGSSSKIDQIQGVGLLPSDPGPGVPQAALQLPSLYKEDMAQVWLADPDPNVKLPDCTAIDSIKHQPVCYTRNTLNVYWGNSTTDKAALELTLIYYGKDPADGIDKYISQKWYLDSDQSRVNTNKFEFANCPSTPYPIDTSKFQCKKTLALPSPPNKLMALRVRLLYNATPQPVAVQGEGCSGAGCNLPPQARLITSTGSSGETQRKINLFQLYRVVPSYFDYAIFSAGGINK